MQQILFIRAYSACTIRIHVTGETQEKMQLKDYYRNSQEVEYTKKINNVNI